MNNLLLRTRRRRKCLYGSRNEIFFYFRKYNNLSCFSCASADYQKLMESNRNLAGRVPIRIFDSACESNELREV